MGLTTRNYFLHGKSRVNMQMFIVGVMLLLLAHQSLTAYGYLLMYQDNLMYQNNVTKCLSGRSRGQIRVEI